MTASEPAMIEIARPRFEGLTRALASALAISACVGIWLEAHNLMASGQSLGAASWALAGYFTILTNGLVAALFGAIALGGPVSNRPRLTMAVVAAIVLVGVIYALLLQGLRPLGGATAAANFLLHQLNPALALVFWLACTRKGKLGWRDPLLWTLYPLAYLVYALARGQAEGRYPYPFLDVAKHGWAGVALSVAAISLCFVAAGEVMVWADKALAKAVRTEGDA